MIKCRHCSQPFHNIYAYSNHRDWQPTKQCLSQSQMNEHGMAFISGAWVTCAPPELKQAYQDMVKRQNQE